MIVDAPWLIRKKTVRGGVPLATPFAYYRHTTDFTGGAAFLMMARARHKPGTALEDAALAARLARTRFEWGATDAAPWLDAQRAQRSAQLDRVTNRLARLENRIDLFLARGGG